MNATDPLTELICAHMAESTADSYTSSWREACGGPSSEPPMPVAPANVPLSHLVFGRGRESPATYAHGWTTTKDELGTWWSYRQIIRRAECLGDNFDMWQGHDTRQAAKARARGNAKVQNMHLNHKKETRR